MSVQEIVTFEMPLSDSAGVLIALSMCSAQLYVSGNAAGGARLQRIGDRLVQQIAEQFPDQP